MIGVGVLVFGSVGALLRGLGFLKVPQRAIDLATRGWDAIYFGQVLT